MTDPKPAPADDDGGALWRRPEILRRVGLGATTVDELEKRDRFPRRVVLSPRAVAWRSWEVRRWMELGPDGWQRDIAARDQVRVA